MGKYIVIYINQIGAIPLVFDDMNILLKAIPINDDKIIAFYNCDNTGLKGLYLFINNKTCDFVIRDRFKLTKFVKCSIIDKSHSYIFYFEDLSSNSQIEITTPKMEYINMLDYLIRELVYASKFPTWKEYQDRKAKEDEVLRLKEENEQLKKELQACKEK